MARTVVAAIAGAIAVSVVTGQQWTALAGSPGITWDGVFDARRQRFVQLAGLDQGIKEWNGIAWCSIATGVPPFAAPVARINFSTADDPIRGRIWVFGGKAVSTLADLWYFDGFGWTQVSASGPPPRRTNAAMAFDTARDRLVLFGGRDSTLDLNDTWEFDGVVWTQLANGAPPWAPNSRAVFDAARGRVLLLGSGTYYWSGTAWTSAATDVTTPTTRMAYDATRQRVVAYRSDPVPALREWNGTAWSTVPQTGVPILTAPTLWHDPAAGNIVIASTTLGGAQLIWNGTALQRTSSYAQASNPAWFFDPVRGRGVAFGGSRSALASNDTWTWDGRQWTEMAPATRPPPRALAASTFDTARGLGLVYGGTASGGLLRDLWGWDGANWTLLAATGPPPVMLVTMAFDSVRSRAVLFGGIGNSGFNQQTWEWDGAVWTQVPTAQSPPAAFGAMAYDPVRARTVFQAGGGTPTTWEWNGVQWQRIVTAHDPSVQTLLSATYDAGRARIALVASVAGGVWDYDGVDWTRRQGIVDSVATAPIAAIYDTRRQLLSLFDGEVVQELQTTAAAIDSYGGACGTPTTVLMARCPPRLGEARFGLDVAAAPGAIAAFGLSISQANVAMGGSCTLLVGPLFADTLALADVRGLAGWGLPVPALPSLLGSTVFAQAGCIDSSGALRMSQGLRLVVGE